MHDVIWNLNGNGEWCIRSKKRVKVNLDEIKHAWMRSYNSVKCSHAQTIENATPTHTTLMLLLFEKKNWKNMAAEKLELAAT